MTRILLAALLVVSATPALAATTWASITLSATDYRGPRSVRATCTTGTESAPSASTDGMDVTEVGSYVVVVEAATSGQTVASGTLQAYFYDPVDAIWVRIPDLDLTVPATAARGYTFLGSSPGLGVPIIARGRGRLAYVPSGVTISSGSAWVKLLATGSRGEAL